jgi:uncharacterized heparinase superfamily protein
MNSGSPQWSRIYKRVRAMSREEIADRLRQQTTARLDWWRYQAGMSPTSRLRSAPLSQAQPHFFFLPDAVPQLCARLRQLFPKETEQIVRRAEKVCQHRFDLMGYTDLDYGVEIDWHCDRVHGKRALRKPWFRIRYLDFAEVGDSKITWELNRHQHFVTLAIAYRLTGEEKFAVELFRQWKHWHRENPYPIGINWASSLEVAFRSLSWLWTYYLMSGSSAMPEGFREELLRSLAISGRHIECYLSTYFSPNTHLLGEAVALFFIGTLCPELPSSSRWQQRGWSVIQQEAGRQVRPDGWHDEQSTYYHIYALDFFLHAVVLASRNEIAVPESLERTLERMLQALYVAARSGPVPRLGDDDGGRLFDGQRNLTGDLLDPLAAGAVLFHRGDFKSVVGGLRVETVWLLGEQGIAEFDHLPAAPSAHASTAFPDSGIYIISDGAGQVAVDAGPQGTDTAGHGHADALSVVINYNRRPLLIDSGTYQYVGPGDDRDRFRGTKAHNTLVVDGCDQSEPKGPFSWVNLPNVHAEGWITGETFDLFVASHDGYCRLAEAVTHRRFVFSRKGSFWFVRDQAAGRGQHQLDLYWHLSPDLSPVDGRHVIFRGEDAELSILVPENCGWSRNLLQQDWSPTYGRKEAHNVLHLSTTATLPVELATLLLPAGRTTTLESRFAPVVAAESAVCYRFTTGSESHVVIFGQTKPWTMGPWSSDAEFLYCCEDANTQRRRLICCNGGFVDAGGRRIISSPETFLRCEILSAEGEPRVVCSHPATAVNREAFAAISVQERA